MRLHLLRSRKRGASSYLKEGHQSAQREYLREPGQLEDLLDAPFRLAVDAQHMRSGMLPC